MVARIVGDGGGLLLGVDLNKDPAVLHRAYNDEAGVTAAFNLNLLRRINRELGADFDLDRWQHRAIYNVPRGRIEMHLVSLARQVVHLQGVEIRFEPGETIWTESSYKYSVEELQSLAHRAGFAVERVWMDTDKFFSVYYLESGSAPRGVEVKRKTDA